MSNEPLDLDITRADLFGACLGLPFDQPQRETIEINASLLITEIERLRALLDTAVPDGTRTWWWPTNRCVAKYRDCWCATNSRRFRTPQHTRPEKGSYKEWARANR